MMTEKEYWQTTREWEEQTVIILGGGPSAHHILELGSHVRDFRTIAINDSFRLHPYANILYFCDYAWWQKRQQEVFLNFHGDTLVTLEKSLPGVLRLRNAGPTGLETECDAIRHGSNSGYQAINLAYHLGARKIILVGFDMRLVDGRAHWNHDHVMEQNEEGFHLTLQNTMLPKFETLVQPLAAAGVEVINATPYSALTCWRYQSLLEALGTEATTTR